MSTPANVANVLPKIDEQAVPTVPRGVAAVLPKEPEAWQMQYVKPGLNNQYTTKLTPEQETVFQNWVKQNNIPWQDVPKADYDMRGFWREMQSNPNAAGMTGINPNDHLLHYTDKFKTPYHKSFSGESMYSIGAEAPRWINDYQLADKSGKILYDEKAEAAKRKAK